MLDPVDLLVLDDVHLADGALQSLFSVAITRREHPALFDRLATTLADRLPTYRGCATRPLAAAIRAHRPTSSRPTTTCG